jgi:hypothetical protein
MDYSKFHLPEIMTLQLDTKGSETVNQFGFFTFDGTCHNNIIFSDHFCETL